MQQHWVDSTKLHNGQGPGIWEVDYSSFPLLDPSFPDRPSRLLRFIQMTHRRIQADNDAYAREMARLLRPGTEPVVETGAAPPAPSSPAGAQISEYLREADVYLCSTIRLLPELARERVRPARVVSECVDLRELLALFFTSDSPRVRFEAQRKLMLALLLLDIEHSRHIQDGPRHKAFFEQLLTESMWRHTRQVHELEIGYRISGDGDTIEYTSRPSGTDQRWHFQSIFLEKEADGRRVALDVLYHNCRFKRTVQPISFEIVDGHHRVLERVRWGEMRHHSSGSILSKMVRKGINNPDEITDLVGAMFIVHDEEALNDLLTLLDGSIGNPFGWRNVTDTLASATDRANLGRHSGRGYKVFKGDADILVPGRCCDQPPYRFTVEIQIYSLEGYLRTVCGRHEASHLALKLRQFLHGLVPRIFPRTIYGSDWLTFD